MSEPGPVPDAWRAKIDAAVADGDVGRGVQLLETWIGRHAYTPWALERLGALFLAAGFRKEAGRALFWAGVRDGDGVERAIEQFLAGRGGRPEQVLRSLARRAQLPLDQYPAPVRADLERLGVTAAACNQRLGGAPKRRPGWPGNLLGCVVLLFVMSAIGAAVVHGTRVLWRWLFG